MGMGRIIEEKEKRMNSLNRVPQIYLVNSIHPITVTHPRNAFILCTLPLPPPPADNKAGRYLARSLALDTPLPPVPAPRARQELPSLHPLRKPYQRRGGTARAPLSEGAGQRLRVYVVVRVDRDEKEC